MLAEAKAQLWGVLTMASPRKRIPGWATHVIHIEDYIGHKMRAISQHRTQYPIKPDMFPEQMLKTLFGREYFVQIYPPPTLETEL